MSHPLGILCAMSAYDVARAVHLLMRRQHGLVTIAQCLAAGMGVQRVRSLVDTGVWRRVRPGVFAAAGAPATYEQAVLAAVLAAGDGTLAACRTAAVVWSLPRFDADGLEVVTTTARRMRLDGVRAIRSYSIFDADRTVRRGLPVTSAERTIVDLSSTVPADLLGKAFDDLIRRGLATSEALARCIGRLTPAPGRRPSVIHRILEVRLPGYDPGDSDLETRALHALLRAGVDLPRQQWPVRLRGKPYEIDLAWPELKIAVELEGFRVHGLMRSRFDSDRERRNALVLDGWLVLQFTTAHDDDAIVRAVTDAFALRAAA